MSAPRILYEHPDADGTIEFAGGVLIACNDLDATVTRICIGPAGLRVLAERMVALSNELEGARK